MHALCTHSYARLHVLFVCIATLVTYVVAIAAYSVGNTAAGSVMTSQHGSGYEYLDCSACLTVAHMLSERMNSSLKSGPSTILMYNQERGTPDTGRRDYRTSEIRVDDVLNGLCRERFYQVHKLRVNPVSKIRGYHLLRYDDLGRNAHPSLLDNRMFPSNGTLSVTDRNAWLPIANFYSQKDHQALIHLQHRAVPALCDTLMLEYESEMSDIVRYATYSSQVEEQLCGLNAPSPTSLSTNAAHHEVSKLHTKMAAHGALLRANQSKGRLIQPIMTVCQDADTLRRSARREQLRWALFNQRRNTITQRDSNTKMSSQQNQTASARRTKDDANTKNDITADKTYT